MSIFSKIGKVLKKIAAPVLGIAGGLLMPGVGNAVGGAIGNLFSSKQADAVMPPNAGPQQESVNITGQKPGFDWGGTLQSAAPIIAGGMSMYGQSQTNAANAQMAQQQMDFQQQQTSTAYQRGTADMKAAGLNPMLAYQQGGASSGMGAQATMGNELGEGANSALSALSTIQQLQNMKAQVENTEAQTDLVGAQAGQTRASTVTELARPGLVSAQTKDSEKSAEQRAQDIQWQILKNKLLSDTFEDEKSLVHSAAHLKRYEAEGARLGLNEKGAYSRYWGDVGKGGVYAQKVAEGVNSVSGALGKLIGGKRR